VKRKMSKSANNNVRKQKCLAKKEKLSWDSKAYHHDKIKGTHKLEKIR
jgi:hypothetical protein